MAVLALAASAIHPAVPESPRTLLGLRPASADMLWMSVLRGAGRSIDYAVTSRHGRGPSASLAARSVAAIRMAPDQASRGWDAILILGMLGDTIGARSIVEGMRAVVPHDRWLPMAEAAWVKWGMESDTAGALRMLEDAHATGQLDANGLRFARGLAVAAGETALAERFRPTIPAEK